MVESVVAHSRQGRPVLVGTRSIAASEDLSARLAPPASPIRCLNAKQDEQEAALVASAGDAGQVTIATNMAGRGTDIKLDDAVRAAGGLHVILTELHDASRVDRQLAGRCARMGDLGSWGNPVPRRRAGGRDAPILQAAGWRPVWPAAGQSGPWHALASALPAGPDANGETPRGYSRIFCCAPTLVARAALLFGRDGIEDFTLEQK